VNDDAIGEVKILTQGYQAGYGQTRSGLQITAVTKSHQQVPRFAYDIRRTSTGLQQLGQQKTAIPR